MRKGLVTTNEQKPTGQGEPRKLNIITSAIIPEAKLQPEPKGTDLNKMITTHDIGDEVILREEDKVDVEMGKPIPLDEPKRKIVDGPGYIHKKAGRPKKAE